MYIQIIDLKYSIELIFLFYNLECNHFFYFLLVGLNSKYWPVSEEFDYGKGSRGVPEDRIEVRGVQIDSVIAKITVLSADRPEDRPRSWRNRRRSGAQPKQAQKTQNQIYLRHGISAPIGCADESSSTTTVLCKCEVSEVFVFLKEIRGGRELLPLWVLDRRCVAEMGVVYVSVLRSSLSDSIVVVWNDNKKN